MEREKEDLLRKEKSGRAGERGTQGGVYCRKNLKNEACAYTTFWSETQVFVPDF